MFIFFIIIYLSLYWVVRKSDLVRCNIFNNFLVFFLYFQNIIIFVLFVFELVLGIGGRCTAGFCGFLEFCWFQLLSGFFVFWIGFYEVLLVCVFECCDKGQCWFVFCVGLCFWWLLLLYFVFCVFVISIVIRQRFFFLIFIYRFWFFLCFLLQGRVVFSLFLMVVYWFFCWFL